MHIRIKTKNNILLIVLHVKSILQNLFTENALNTYTIILIVSFVLN